jgi:hypothetical protein
LNETRERINHGEHGEHGERPGISHNGHNGHDEKQNLEPQRHRDTEKNQEIVFDFLCVSVPQWLKGFS